MLLEDLAELKDCLGIQKYASYFLNFELGNSTAIFWLIVALIKMGSQQMASSTYLSVKEHLTEAEFAKLQKELKDFYTNR